MPKRYILMNFQKNTVNDLHVLLFIFYGFKC